MSVHLMSAIFQTEFFDLKDSEGNITKAATAKSVLLAMADSANDEGEGAYPSIETMCRKTALSAQTIRNTWDALRYNGIIYLKGMSKYNTNNHTINANSFPKSTGKEHTRLTLYPLDPLTGNVDPSNRSLESVLPVIPESLLTIQESSLHTDEIKGKYDVKKDRQIDELLAMSKFPGAKKQARIDSILSYIGGRLHVNAENKKWQAFAKFVDDRQMQSEETLSVFFDWLVSQKGFDLQFWPPSKMQEFWPSAFAKDENIEFTRLL